MIDAICFTKEPPLAAREPRSTDNKLHPRAGRVIQARQVIPQRIETVHILNAWPKTVVMCILIGWVVTPLWAHEVRIDHVTVVSPERSNLLRDVSVSIKDDRIVAVGRSAHPGGGSPDIEIIDGKGLYLAPGLIDSHVHADLPGIEDVQEKASPAIARSMREQEPRSFLYFGFTTLVDLIGMRETTDAWNALPVRPDRRRSPSTRRNRSVCTHP